MRLRLFVIFFSLGMGSCSVSSFGQGGKTVYMKDLSGVSKQENSYEVVGNVDLNGRTLLVPKGSTVVFKGGRISNGTILLDDVKLEGNVCIDGKVKGTITNNEIKASWFGLKNGSKSDQTKVLQSIINLYKSNVSSNSWDINLENPEPTIIIPSGKYNVGEITLRSYVTIKGAGRGSTELHGVTFKAEKQYNITIEDLTITGDVGSSKKSTYDINNGHHTSAFLLKDCARLIFKNVCVKNYNVAYDMYNTYLVDLYSCFASYCSVVYLNDGKGAGFGGHAIRWFGGEICCSVYGFIQKNGNNVFINGSTIENCRYGIYCINPASLTINACGFEANNYDIYGNITHMSVENNYFSKTGKERGDAYIYASNAIGYSIIQGNTFDLPVFNSPHILINESTQVLSNILIGQNFVVNGSRIPLPDRLLPFVIEKGVNKYQTYLPDGKNMLMGQTIVYKNLSTGKYYIVTRDEDGELLFSLLQNNIEK